MIEIIDLIEILKDEKTIYKDILELANKKTNMIAEENIAEIEKISKQEEQYIKEAKLLEYKREDKISEIEKSLVKEKINDISILLQHISDEKLKEQLSYTRDEFTKVINELKSVNSMNNILIQDALEYISLSLNIMSGATAEGTYGKNPQNIEPQTLHKNMFDFKG